MKKREIECELCDGKGSKRNDGIVTVMGIIC